MGFHYFDIIIVVIIGMLIFGPQALQKWARSAGKGVKQANDLKNQALSELPVDELSSISRKLSSIPTSPQQVAAKLLIPEPKEDQSEKTVETPAKE